MACERIVLPGGGFAIVCGLRRRRCGVEGCYADSTRQCDNPVIKRGVARSCDASVCPAHATPIGNGKRDLCPRHRAAALAARAAARPVPHRAVAEVLKRPIVLWRGDELAGFFERVGAAAEAVATSLAHRPEDAAASWAAQVGQLVLQVEIVTPAAKPRARKVPVAKQGLLR